MKKEPIMGKKSITILVLLVIAILAVWGGSKGYVGQNDDQNWQVLQGVLGKMRIQTDAGYYQKRFASDYTYPKLRQVYFSDDIDEGGAKDGSCNVIFKDKGRAKFNSNVVYNTPHLLANDAISDEVKGLVASPTAGFHRLCKGDVEAADRLILARLKEYAIGTAEKLNASDCAENQSVYIGEVRKLLRSDALLISKGIDIEELALSGFTFDGTTLLQFKTQQDAILASKAAEAKKIQYEMEKLETVAEYEQLIAKEKGMADMEKMKATTDADRDAELATIEAKKNVDVALLAKEQAETVAEQLLSVVTIEKKAALMVASQGLEVAEIAALSALEDKKAVIAKAEGKQKAIELSGEITEEVRVLATIEADKQVAISANLSLLASPQTIFIGGGTGGDNSHFDNLMGYGMAQQFGLIPANANAMPVKITNPKK